MKEIELIIVGGGPGGIAAAVEAAKAGVEVALLDENPKLGGQIYRQYEDGFKVANPGALGRDYKRGRKLLEKFNEIHTRVDYLNSALVWGIFPERELVYQREKKSLSLRYGQLIVAVGAYDRPVPFPGWTLPGVMTAGGAQRFVKMQRVLPGERILLAGTGPLQLVLASQIIEAGGKIEAILEAGNITDWFVFAKAMWGQWDLLWDGLRYWSNILKARIPVLRRHIILEARGSGRVEEALIAEVDNDWRPKSGSERTLTVDTICLGYGLIPGAEMTWLADCEHRYEPRLGGWIPIRSENLETSVPGVFAVGDGSGVKGSQTAIAEGRLAGISAAQALGYISADQARQKKLPVKKQLKRLKRFRKAMDDISEPRAGLFELAREDTIVCRCEEITLGEIKDAIAKGGSEINEIKRMTRMGMGRCQGRMCGPAMIEFISRQLGPDIAAPDHLRPRPPIKPIELGVLANHAGRE